MDKESIVDVLTADTDVFFACWDTDNGWQVLTNGNASFPAALFAQKGIEALRDVVAESDSRLCDNFLQEIDRGVERHNNEDVIKGNCRTVHMHILDMHGECIYYRLKCNFMKRDDGSIEKIVFQARELDAKSGLPYLVEGDILAAQGKVGEACAKYETAAYFSPDCVGAYLKQARLYMSANRSLSLEKLDKAREKSPEFCGIYCILGELYEMTGDSKAAADNYSKFIQSGYYDQNNLLRYAGILYFDKQYDKMLPILQSVLREKPEDLVAKRLYAYCLSKRENGEKCLEAIKHFIESTPEESQICQDYLCYAEQLTLKKEYNEAITYYKKALNADGKRQELLKDIADLFVKNRELDSAVVYYQQYFDFVEEPAAEDLLKLGKCYYNLACQDSVPELQKEELIKADTLFKELSIQVPNSYVSYFWRARVNSMLDPETTKGLAKPYYEKVIEIGSVQPERYKRELIESYKYLGYYHYVIADAITTKNNGNPDPAKEEYGEAKSFFSKVLTLDAKDEVALKALESIKL